MTRDEFFRDVLPQGSAVAELGVFLGEFADVILKLNSPRLLELIDPWPPSGFQSGDANGRHPLAVSNMEAVYHRLKAKYWHWPEVTLHRMTSLEYLQDAARSSLDCVYIDTTHEHADTYAELWGAARVIRSGGWVGGHDFNLPGVERAVAEFRERAGITDMLLTDEACPSYFIRVL
jgi:hypothetical protein